MKKDTHKLIRMAFITAPLLAIYNVAPISLFINSGLTNSNVQMIPQFNHPVRGLIPVFFIAVNTLVLWFFNIWLVNKSKQVGLGTRWRYVMSFLFTLCFIASLQVITRDVRPPIESLGTLQFYPFIGSAANNAFILIMIDLILNRERRASLEIEKANLLATNLKSRHELLKQQIQPHFLFNALNTLKLLINRDQGSAEAYTIRLSSFLRASISDGLEEKLSIKKDLEIFADFMELQMVRFPGSIEFYTTISEDTLQRGFLPAFTLQTLAENAIKHNEFSNSQPLVIEINEIEGNILFSSTYTPKNVVSDSVGIGLKNLSERFRILCGRGVEVENDGEFFMVKFKAIDV